MSVGMLRIGGRAGIWLLLLFSGHCFGSSPKTLTAQDRAHWAFQPVTRPEPPRVHSAISIRNPIDRFISARLEKEGIPPARRAEKRVLIRRAYLDVIGLPPSPEEVDRFVADDTPQAYERVVERLLASERYGERWARYWLDLARYAESEGFKEDQTRPNIWRYRDYVIRSFNADKPYDQFIKEQLAGDELWPGNFEAFIATAFNRHYPDEHNARNLRQRRQEILNDITDTVGVVITGMTYGCARCHDHKFDPILQTDYYRLQAFFANIAPADNVPLVSSNELKAYEERLRKWEEQTAAIRERLAELEAPKRKEIIDELIYKYPAEIQAAIFKPAAERSSFEWLMFYKARQYLDPESHLYVAPTQTVVSKLKGGEKKEWEKLKEQLDSYSHLHPGKLPVASGMRDVSSSPPRTYLLSRGNYDQPKEEVEPAFLQVLNVTPSRHEAASHQTTGRRSQLAAILTDAQNPLTARVMVNRIWQSHFGKGIVGTPSDFGLKGDKPTHPELLDWLASEFIRNGWSMKYIHRLILTSATYQQSAVNNDAGSRVDPDDKLLWRFPRQRLQGEAIRDSGLAVADLLNPKMGGQSVWPELPPGMAARGGWKVSVDPAERNRRSIYVGVKRNTRYPLFETFDMPDSHESCSRRNTTTSPVQALTMLNSEVTYGWAGHFAARVYREAGHDLTAQIAQAYRIAYGRLPDAKEKGISAEFFNRHKQILDERIENGDYPPDFPGPLGKADASHAAALVDFCHMLLNSNEFVYLN